MNLKTIRDRCTEDGDCWIWSQSVNSAGYPQACINSKGGQMVRRQALIEVGKSPSGRYKRVTDSCGNRLCCNPEHLRWSCFSDLLKESYRTGRRSTKMEYLRRLEAAKRTGKAKLDWPQVRAIRARLATESCAKIAAEYGMGENAITAIKFNRSWREASPWA